MIQLVVLEWSQGTSVDPNPLCLGEKKSMRQLKRTGRSIHLQGHRLLQKGIELLLSYLAPGGISLQKKYPGQPQK
jgi:hypothetical protein